MSLSSPASRPEAVRCGERAVGFALLLLSLMEGEFEPFNKSVSIAARIEHKLSHGNLGLLI